MSKYIEAEELKAFMRTMLTGNDLYTPNGIDEFVDRLPAADVQEVRHGRWVDVEPAPHNLFYATCSVCGDRQTIEVANYCPNCGASTDEVEE